MRVFWDGYGLNSLSGVATYGEHLAEGLLGLGLVPEIVVPSAPFLPRILNSKPLWATRVARLVAPRASAGDVLHGLSNFNVARPRGASMRVILTVHDLIPFFCPEGVSTASYWQLRALLPRALDAADAVICVSEWTRATVAERYPKAARKLRVIRHGLVSAPEIAQTPRVGAGPRTLFFTARGEIYKQIPLYLDVLVALGEGTRGILLTDARGCAQAERTHPALLASGRLELRTGVSREAYEALFARADVYVHTSRFEGYCLPAADALRHGVPIVYQAGSATDELLGADVATPLPPNAALIDWVGAVNEAMTRKGTPEYLEKRQNRLGSLPSWSDAARAHAALYSGV